MAIRGVLEGLNRESDSLFRLRAGLAFAVHDVGNGRNRNSRQFCNLSYCDPGGAQRVCISQYDLSILQVNARRRRAISARSRLPIELQCKLSFASSSTGINNISEVCVQEIRI